MNIYLKWDILHSLRKSEVSTTRMTQNCPLSLLETAEVMIDVLWMEELTVVVFMLSMKAVIRKKGKKRETNHAFPVSCLLYLGQCSLNTVSTKIYALYTTSLVQELVETFYITWITRVKLQRCFSLCTSNAQSLTTESNCLHTVNRQILHYLPAKLNLQPL